MGVIIARVVTLQAGGEDSGCVVGKRELTGACRGRAVRKQSLHFCPAFLPGIVGRSIGPQSARRKTVRKARRTTRLRRMLLYEIKMCPHATDNKRDIGGGGGSRTRVRKCYWSRDYMLIPVHAPGITLGRSRPTLRTDKKR